MANKKFSEIKVGIFVFVAFFIVILTVFWVKGFLIEKTQRDMSAYFTNISGLNIGDPVSVNGVKKGKVTDIDLEGDSVIVKFSIEKEIKIRKDYTIEVAILELMGGKQLYIVPGKSNEEIDYNHPLAGAVASDIGKFIRDISGITNNVKELITKFDNATDNLNKVLLSVNDIVGDQNVKSDLKSTLSNIAVTSRNLNVLVTENKNTLKELTHKIGNTVDNVNGLVGETNPNLQNTFKDVQALTSRIDTLVGNLNLIVLDVQSQKSGVGKFMHDDKFFDNLNKTLEEIQTLSKKIRKDGVKINLF